MTRAAIALGSNLGDRLAYLRYGAESLAELGAVVSVSSSKPPRLEVQSKTPSSMPSS